jgi:hypothetical protein
VLGLRHAGPLLLSYSNHICHTRYHTARCGRLAITTLQAEFQPTQRYAIVWPLFSHTNNRRAVTLLQKFPNMEGILPTTKDATYCSSLATLLRLAGRRKLRLQSTEFLYSHVRTTEIVQRTTVNVELSE